MGDVFDAMNRAPEPPPRPDKRQKADSMAADGDQRLFSNMLIAPSSVDESPGLPIDEIESVARVTPGTPLHNQQPLNLRITTSETTNGECAPNVIAYTDRTSPIAEQYRQIRTQILARSKTRPRQTHLLASATPQEGKSLTTVNLGVVFSELRPGRTLLIEADLRRPGFQRIFDRPFATGLIHILRQNIKDETEAIHPTACENLHIMPAGECHEALNNELFSSHAMVRLLDRLKDHYDHILIDSPPVISVSDACMLGALCDETILVVRMHKTPRDVVQQAKCQLEAAGCTMAGAVMTHVQHDHMPQYLSQHDA